MFCEGFCGVLVNVVLVIAAVLGLHYVYLLWNSDYWKKRGVFCPDSKALFGNLPGQVNGKRSIVYDLDDLYQKYKGQHSCIGIYSFRQPRLLVLDPELMKDIMIKYFKHFQGTEFAFKIDPEKDPLFGNHPFFLVGDAWKSKRNEISPAFTNTRVSSRLNIEPMFTYAATQYLHFSIFTPQIKAIFPITQEVNKKMISYIRREIAKADHDGFDAKDVNIRFDQ
jgi:cytochrome P450 family 28